MKKLISDLKTVWITNWKTILLLTLVILLIRFYPEIKQGFSDGWANK